MDPIALWRICRYGARAGWPFIEKPPLRCYLLHRSRVRTSIRAHKTEDHDLSDYSLATPVAPRGPGMTAGPQTATSERLLDAILASLSDDKAEDVVQIDLRGKSEMGDYMVIASGRSTRQVSAIAEKLVDRLKAEFGTLCKIEGKETGDWVLIDSGDVIVHVFRPEVREFYQLEKMWMPSDSPAAAAKAR